MIHESFDIRQIYGVAPAILSHSTGLAARPPASLLHMHIAVLCSPDSWYFKDLLRAAAERRHEITPLHVSLPWRRIWAATAQRFRVGGADLAAVDAVLVRTMPPGTLEQVVFRMDVLARLEAAGKLVVNPPRAIEAAVDKYLASAKLAAAGPANPAHDGLPDGRRRADGLSTRWAATWSLKPLFGAEGRGIARLERRGPGPTGVQTVGATGRGALPASSSFRMMGTTCACWSSASGCGPCGGATRSTGGPTSAAAPRPSRWN